MPSASTKKPDPNDEPIQAQSAKAKPSYQRAPLNTDDEPIQYKRGYTEFYKLKFKVNKDALIPRPETELLVDAVIKAQPKTLLDIGTGAGNIAISAAKNMPELRVTATEISSAALMVAKANARFQKVDDRIDFVTSDLLGAIDGQYDMIVTNLPYIPSARIPYLESSVKDFEPWVALDGGEDGFELYRQLFAQMAKKEIFPKLLIGEIDYTHGEMAVNVAEKYFPKCQAEVKLDLAHKQRFLIIHF